MDMQPQEPFVRDPEDPPGQTPQREVIEDPDMPLEAPIDDVFDPTTEAPDVTD
jgi:hypothetical protein